jgi:hypothetical protein
MVPNYLEAQAMMADRERDAMSRTAVAGEARPAITNRRRGVGFALPEWLKQVPFVLRSTPH